MNRRLSPGDGIITCALNAQLVAGFEDIQFSYPLKLVVPSRRYLPHVQCIYVIGYGGGLVAGDRVRMKVEVREGSTLAMLTQASSFCSLRPQQTPCVMAHRPIDHDEAIAQIDGLLEQCLTIPPALQRTGGVTRERRFEAYLEQIRAALVAEPNMLVTIVGSSIRSHVARDCLLDLNIIQHEMVAGEGWRACFPAKAVAHILLHSARIRPAYAAASNLANHINSQRDRSAAGLAAATVTSEHQQSLWTAFQNLGGTTFSPSGNEAWSHWLVRVTKRLSVLCYCLGYAPTAPGEVTSGRFDPRAASLYTELSAPFAAANQERKDECIKRLHMMLDLGQRNPDMIARLDIWPKPGESSRTEASLSKPEIGRRTASMYFPGGTKEGWEKAMRGRM
ncbi:hypothetical protein JCM11641_007187 [Rhodosporidiobolus odoratus]